MSDLVKATKTFVVPDDIGGRYSVITPVDSANGGRRS